ncbi:MAG TPA: hypothetical protein VKF79_08175 [Candidatus Acidoferrum sp.]|nr:hypothetical protein [Candidatus Acidoferrum sp.]
MAYSNIEKPIRGPYCFADSDDASILSQAAVLLATGATLRGDDAALEARATAAGLDSAPEVVPREDADIFPVPRVTAGIAGRQNTAQTRVGIELRYGRSVLETDNSEKLHKAVIPDLAERHYRQPSIQTASELMEASLVNDAEIVRVAAASAYFELSAEPERLLNILAEGTHSDDELTREVAATALANVSPTHPALQMFREEAGAGAAAAGATTLMIHGTWAANERWWQSNGVFFDYILNNVRTDLYNHSDRFGWSGVYSDAARLQASQDLIAWMASHNEEQPDMITHSHGGSVAFLATQAGQTTGELVLLSCPVHLPKYLPDFTKIRKTVSIRVHLDLVLLADRSGQKFSLAQIQENVLPIWFDHSKTHDPATWQRYNVESML